MSTKTSHRIDCDLSSEAVHTIESAILRTGVQQLLYPSPAQIEVINFANRLNAILSWVKPAESIEDLLL